MVNKKEQWLPVNEHENYQISDLGRVKHVIKNCIVEPMKDRYKSYVNIGQGNDRKKRIHKLVAEHFVPKDDPEQTKIIHIDGNRFNNKASNLKWAKKEVLSNHVFKRNTNKAILQYDMEMNLIKKWRDIKELIEETDYYTGHIYKSLNGTSTSAYNFIWKYEIDTEKIKPLENDEVFNNVGIFKEIDFSNYEISNYGKGKHKNRTNHLQINENNKKSNTIQLYDINNKCYTIQIHLLVAHLFIPRNNNEQIIINHKDDNLKNNCYKNLEWITTEQETENNKRKLEEINKKDNALENWLPANGFSNYIISDLGRIRSIVTNNILKPTIDNSYYRVYIASDIGINKSARVHRLVAKAFKNNDDPTNKIIVDHIDNNKLNNRAINLQWVTYKENSENYCNNYKEPYHKPILQYDKNMNLIGEWYSINEIISECGYDRGTIYNCINGKYQYAHGFIWCYKYEDNVILRDDETFKNVGIFEGKDFSKYEVSNYGNVKSLRKNIYFKLCKSGNYLGINLKDQYSKKQFKVVVHRLVAHCFVDGRTEEKKIVNHLDENKHNNYYKNLEWVTNTENIIYSLGIMINQIDITTGAILNTFESINTAKRYLNLNSTISITRHLKNPSKFKQGYGYKWEYAN
jgi:hypothetical protein